jgi:hypothetical protein
MLILLVHHGGWGEYDKSLRNQTALKPSVRNRKLKRRPRVPRDSCKVRILSSVMEAQKHQEKEPGRCEDFACARSFQSKVMQNA